MHPIGLKTHTSCSAGGICFRPWSSWWEATLGMNIYMIDIKNPNLIIRLWHQSSYQCSGGWDSYCISPILDVGFSKGHRINHDFHLHFQQPCLWPFGGCLIFSGTCNITHHAWQWRLNGRKKVGKCSHAGQTSSKSSVASNKVFANYLEIIIPHISHRGHHFEFLWSSFCRVWTHDIAQPLRNLRCLMEH